MSTDPGAEYAESPEGSDERFRYGTGAGKSIATSTAVQDAGLFNLDFRDERYLPFEYDGAISGWNLTLPGAVRQFDYRTISDVVIHIDYSSRDGGSTLRDSAEANLLSKLADAVDGMSLVQTFVVHDAFPNEWEQLFTEPGVGNNHSLNLPVSGSMFPHFASRGSITVSKYELVVVLEPGAPAATLPVVTSFGATDLLSAGGTVVRGEVTATGAPAAWTFEVDPGDIPTELATAGGYLDRTKIQGMVVIAHYTVSFGS